MTKLDHALRLARNGKRVFPCGKNKKPITRHGFKDATTDPKKARAWWTEHPDAMVAVATGPGSGVLVVDIDDDKAGDYWARNSARLMPARVHETRRGHHCWYRWPEGARISIGQDSLAPGVDHRGDGGYAIYWPAEGKEVEGPKLNDLPPPPDWIVEALSKDKQIVESDEPEDEDEDQDDGDDARPGDKYVHSTEDELEAVIRSGKSLHGPTHALSNKMAARGESEESILRHLQGLMQECKGKVKSSRWVDRYNSLPRFARESVRRFGEKKPELVILRRGRTHKAVDATVSALARNAQRIAVFRRSDFLFRPFVDSRRGFNDETVDSLVLSPLNHIALAQELSSFIEFARVSKGKSGSKRRIAEDCPEKIARTIAARPYSWSSVPAIDRIAPAPIYVGGGSLIAESGYSAQQSAWIECPQGVEIQRKPDAKAAKRALRRLQSWINEFPLADPVSKSAAIAGIMTCVLRPSLPMAPGVAIDAPEVGSGKSTLASLMHVAATGRKPEVTDYVAGPEFTKTLDAMQMEAVAGIVIDNVPRGELIRSPVLSKILSEDSRRPRVLGRSVTIPVRNTQHIILTGNAIEVDEDLARRMIRCRLEAHQDPSSREFRRADLLGEAISKRVEILRDVFTIVAAYECSGESAETLPLAGFEAWRAWVQRPLVWLGMRDPVETTKSLKAEDPDRALLERIVGAWHRRYGHRWRTVSQVLETLDGDYSGRDKGLAEFRRDLVEASDGFNSEINATALGRWLKANAGRWTGGRLSFEHAKGESGSSAKTRVVRAAEENEDERLL